MANVEILIKTIDQTKSGTASVIANTKNIAGAFAVLTTAATIAKGVFDFSKEGAELQRLADAGAEVARQYGGNMDLIINKVREASRGTVSEMDIIASSNRAMLLGLGADADKLANLMEVAALRGRAMGLDTTKAFNDIVTGVGRASPLILDNLGIVVNAKETYSKYAEQLGKSATELTKAEKTQALLNAVLQDGNRMLKEAGGLMVDNTAKVERMEASWKNFTENRKRENADLAGSFSESAAEAIEGWDQFFKFMDSQGEIRERAIEMRDNLDPSGNWQDFYETARVEWAAQKSAIESATEAVNSHAEAAQIAADELKEISKVNQELIDGAIDITSRNKDFADSQQEILDKIAETRAEGEKLYPWEAEKIAENQAKLDELGQAYTDNLEDFKAAMQEKFTLYAVEQIAMSDGVAGFSEAEMEKARIILETTDTATAAAFEEQQAMVTLAQAVTDGIVPVEAWGGILETVMADGVVSVGEVQAAIEAVPKQNTITFDIITNGAPPNLDISTSASSAPVGTHRNSHATGGDFTIPMSYGNEGFMMGGGDTASGGEGLKIIPNGKSGNEDVVQAINANRIDYYEFARAVVAAVQQGSK